MSSNYRVIVSARNGELWHEIRDVYHTGDKPGFGLFVGHGGLDEQETPIGAWSVGSLRETLNDMLKALDKPPMYYHEELREIKR